MSVYFNLRNINKKPGRIELRFQEEEEEISLYYFYYYYYNKKWMNRFQNSSHFIAEWNEKGLTV